MSTISNKEMNEKVERYSKMFIAANDDPESAVEFNYDKDTIEYYAEQIYYIENEELDWTTCIEVSKRINKKLSPKKKLVKRLFPHHEGMKIVDYFNIQIEVPAWTNWITTSEQGIITCYKGKPKLNAHVWTYNDIKCFQYPYKVELDFDWKESLVQVN